MKCNKHPNYRMINPPVSTKKHPGGCETCWDLFNHEHIVINPNTKFMSVLPRKKEPVRFDDEFVPLLGYDARFYDNEWFRPYMPWKR